MVEKPCFLMKVIIGVPSTWDGPLRTMSTFSSIQSLQYSHDGRLIAAAVDRQCQIFLSTTGKRVADLFSGRSLNHLTFSCDNESIAVADRQRIISFDVKTGAQLSKLSTSDLSIQMVKTISFIRAILIYSSLSTETAELSFGTSKPVLS